LVFWLAARWTASSRACADRKPQRSTLFEEGGLLNRRLLDCSVWILEEHDDDRLGLLEDLACAGIRTAAFSSAGALLQRASSRSPHGRAARAALVDAWTARGCEREIHDAVSARLIVLTTRPAQLGAWMRLGVSRFLPKPVEIASLLEHLADDGRRTWPVNACDRPERRRPRRAAGNEGHQR
jgi:hypothetical protein